MGKSEIIKLCGFFGILAAVVLIATLPGGRASADGAGGFPTSTSSIIVVPTFTPTMILIPTATSPYPYPVPRSNTLNMTLPESQSEAAPEAEGGGISSFLCLPVVVVAVIIGLVGFNRIRKNTQGGA
jgi:hypothetical protein